MRLRMRIRGQPSCTYHHLNNITWKHLRMRASNSLRFCDNAEGFARMCLIETSKHNVPLLRSAPECSAR